MKKVIIAFIFCHVFITVNAQEYDTIYFHLNRIELQNTDFISIIEKLRQEKICHHYTKYDFFAAEIDTTGNKFDITLTMLPQINKSAQRAKGYLYIGQLLFVFYGDIPTSFATITKQTKRFYDLIPKPDKYGLFAAKSIQEFCVLLLRIENGRWEIIEERQNY